MKKLLPRKKQPEIRFRRAPNDDTAITIHSDIFLTLDFGPGDKVDVFADMGKIVITKGTTFKVRKGAGSHYAHYVIVPLPFARPARPATNFTAEGGRLEISL